MRQVDGTEALQRVRQARRDATAAEKLLWTRLRSRQLDGFKFRRQVWVGPFIADFLCKEARMIVELDGGQHADAAAYDEARTACLQKEGYRVLRFWNNDVLTNLDGVLLVLREALLGTVPSPSHPAAPGGPLPLPSGEGI